MSIVTNHVLMRSAGQFAIAAGCLLGSLGCAANTCIVNSPFDDPNDASQKVTSILQSGWSGTQKSVVTLRDCIVESNLMTGSLGAPTMPGLTIELSKIAGSVVTLRDNLPMLFNNTVITTTTGMPVVINGDSAHRIFFVSGLPRINVIAPTDIDGAQPIAVALSNLVLEYGVARGGDGAGGGMGAGGALFVNKNANVTLTNVTMTQNHAIGGQALNLETNFILSGGGMGPGASVSRGGGGLGGPGLYASGAGIGTSGTSQFAGGFGGTGIGQLSVSQNFSSSYFDVDAGSGTSGSKIGGGGLAVSGQKRPGGFGGGGGYAGGNGGFGGGGAWTQAPGATGGSGGFGGGGGGGLFSATGGNGGFGAGAGAVGDFAVAAGVSGVGGSIPTVYGGGYSGGDGAGFGGAVFVRSGGTLQIQATTRPTNATNNVALASGTKRAASAGDGIFVMSGAQLTLNIDTRYTIHDEIADDSLVSLPAGQTYMPGNGTGAKLIKTGPGTLVIDGGDARAGLTDVQSGTLAGGGLILGSVNLGGSAMILPGDPLTNGGIGTLSVGSLTWNAGGSMAYQLGADDGGSDHLQIAGTLLKQGTGPFLFYFGTGATPPVAGQTYRLISAGDTSTFTAQDFSFEKDASLQGLSGNFLVDATGVYFAVTAVLQ